MFANPQHIPNDMESNNDSENEHLKCDDDGIMEFERLTTMEQSGLPMGGIVRSCEIINSSTPMERVLAQLTATMQGIINECKKSNVTFCEHATSHMRVLACNIHNICLTKVNAFYIWVWCYIMKMDWIKVVLNNSKIGMKQCSITQMYVLNDVMNICFNY